MHLVIISDTHGKHESVTIPPCDVLIHCGDCTVDAGRADLRNFLLWLEKQPAPKKILVAGNHDWAFEKWNGLSRQMVNEIAPSAIYLEDSGIEIDGFKFWGSPVTPEFFNWAFNRKRGAEIKRHWDKIPNDTDVLITHGPPSDLLDVTYSGKRDGCQDLREAIERVKPKLHVFGHFHRSYGRAALSHVGDKITVLINASICDESYNPTRKPAEFNL